MPRRRVVSIGALYRGFGQSAEQKKPKTLLAALLVEMSTTSQQPKPAAAPNATTSKAH